MWVIRVADMLCLKIVVHVRLATVLDKSAKEPPTLRPPLTLTLSPLSFACRERGYVVRSLHIPVLNFIPVAMNRFNLTLSRAAEGCLPEAS